MLAERAFYSIVQYVPDTGRGEAANAGVVLYVPQHRWLEVRISPSLERIRHFFRPGRQELRRIEAAMESLKNRLELAREDFANENDLAQFAAARADAIRLTAPRLAMVENAAEEIESLYVGLVGDAQRAALTASQGQALPAPVAEVFGRLEAQRKVWRPGRITLPTINRPFEVPIAYQNGRVNYVRPESLAPGGKLDSLMAKLGFNGQLIYRHPIDDKEGQLVVLSADAQADRTAEHRYGRTLQEFNVRFVPNADVQAFAEEVERTAH